jgi:heme A synthase
VNIKLAIIAALLVGLIWFDINWLSQADNQIAYHPLENWTHSLQLLAGILLIVQALRPLGILEVNYDFDTRIRTMRYAQLISAAIYLLFIFLSLPLLSDYNAERDETAIIGISASVAVILPVMLIIAAVMSQFSAAVADTAGSDGLISEFTRRRINPSMRYLLVILLAIGITWTTSIFEIITIAS